MSMPTQECLMNLAMAMMEQRAGHRPRNAPARRARQILDQCASATATELDAALAELARAGWLHAAATAGEALLADRAVSPSGTRMLVARLMRAPITEHGGWPPGRTVVTDVVAPPRGTTITWCPWRWHPLAVLGWGWETREHWRDMLLDGAATHWPQPAAIPPPSRWGLQIGVLTCPDGLVPRPAGPIRCQWPGWTPPTPEDPCRIVDRGYDPDVWTAARRQECQAVATSGLRTAEIEMLQTAARHAVCANLCEIAQEAAEKTQTPPAHLDVVLWDSDPADPAVVITRWLYALDDATGDGDGDRVVTMRFGVPTGTISHETLMQDVQRHLAVANPDGPPVVLWDDLEDGASDEEDEETSSAMSAEEPPHRLH